MKTARKLNLKSESPKGFTLIELLVVIAIIGVLAIVTFLVIDPIELNAKSRDTVRLSDLQTLNQAITVAVQEATTSGSEILCSGGTVPCSGDSITGTRAIDGSGWVKVNLSGRATSLPALPQDPVNNAAHHYSYATNPDGSAWEINAVFESKQYTDPAKNPKMATDGGNNNAVYEIGSDLNIIN